MNKEVYKHLLKTYGRHPRQWLGLLAEIKGFAPIVLHGKAENLPKEYKKMVPAKPGKD